MTAKLGGVLMRVGDALVYVPAAAAVKLSQIPQITRVPGAPEGLLGVALHEGEILPIVSIGPERDSMLVCMHTGALLGVVGGSIVETGMFDALEDGTSVRYGDETATVLDLGVISGRLAPPSWGGAWAG
jgi:hypothetical protein